MRRRPPRARGRRHLARVAGGVLLLLTAFAFFTSFTSANLVPSTWVGVSTHPVAAGQFPPTSTIAFPANGAAYGNTSWNGGCGSALCGTAHDSANGSNILGVQVSIRSPGGYYWNGSAFAASAEDRLAATGTTSWSYPFPASSFASAGGGDGSYTVKIYATDTYGNTQVPATATTFTIDRTPPANALALVAQSPAGSSFQSGTTVYYRGTGGGSGGSFELRNAVTDGGSGPASSTTAALGGTATGWAHTPSSVSSPAGGPYDSKPFGWSEGTTSSPTESVAGADAAANTTASTLTFTNDSAAPTGGALTVNGTAASAAGTTSYSTTGSFAIGARSDYADAGSGLASSTLARQTATLSSADGIAAGTCGSFGAATVVTGSPAQSLSGPACYRYTLTGADHVGNSATITTTALVDTSAPSALSMTLSAATGNAYVTGTTAYVNTQAGRSGGFTVGATATDADTGIRTLTFPALAGLSGGGDDSASPYATTYAWSGAAGAAGAESVTATNTAGLGANGTFTVTQDTTPPTGGALTVNGTPASAAGTASSTSATTFTIAGRTDYTDSGSGLASSTLTVQSETLAGTTCGSPGSGGPYTSATAIAGTTQPSLTAGYCYVYTLTGTDRVGNAASSSTTVAVHASSNLNGVVGGFGCGGTCAWAVGDGGTILYTSTGTSFSAESSGVTANLNDVAAPADDTHVWAVGDGGTILECTASCQTPASAVWTAVASNTTANLYSVGGADDTHVWAVGAGGVIDFWNGTTWTVQQSGKSYDLLGIPSYVQGTTTWAVGTGGTILSTTNGSTWAALTSPTTSTLASVTAYGDANHAWAVGAGGAIVSTSNRTTWSALTSPTTSMLYGVALTKATSPDSGHPIYLVGAGGAIFQSTNGTTFSAKTSPTTNDLLSTGWGSATSVWAVGRSGAIVYTSTTGTTWSNAASASVTLTPSTGSSGSTVTVSGSGFGASKSLSVRFNGSSVTVGGSASTSSTGAIAGATFTVPASPGCATCVVTVSDGTLQAVASFTVYSAPQLTSAASATFAVGSAGNFTVTATGLPAPSLSESGALPAGVTFDPSAGIIAGTPTGSPGAYAIVLTASNGIGSDATQSFTLTVGTTPAFTSAAAATFTAGSAGSFAATASGYPAPAFSETGSLPSGVTLSSAGTLSGTAAGGTGGVYAIVLNAANAIGSAGQSFVLTVDEAPSIASASSATFTVGAAGSFAVAAAGYPAPSFSETGALPAGVTLTSAGTLAGTPAAGTAGTYPITITAGNGIGSTATQSFTLTVTAFTIGGIQFIQDAPVKGTYTCTATVFTSVTCTAGGTAGTNLTGHIELFSGSGAYSYPEGPTATNSTGSPITIVSSSVTGGGTPNPATFTIPPGSADSNDVTLAHQGPNNVWTFSVTVDATTYTLTVSVT